jgi:DNA-binding CsgD family transcriptional regulator
LELSISAKTVENHITNAIKDLKGKLGVMRNC